MCLLLGDRRSVLFSGDHVWWNREQAVLVCSERFCWWDFSAQICSLECLQDLDVAWLLPGHDHRHAFVPDAWSAAVRQTLSWIADQG